MNSKEAPSDMSQQLEHRVRHQVGKDNDKVLTITLETRKSECSLTMRIRIRK